mgnify:CR=1 FL=1
MANLIAQMQRIAGPIVPNHEIQIGTGHDPMTIVQSFTTRSKCNTATIPKTTPDMTKYARAFIPRPYAPIPASVKPRATSEQGEIREVQGCLWTALESHLPFASIFTTHMSEAPRVPSLLSPSTEVKVT